MMFEYYVKKVTKVVDGDTIDVEIDLGFDISFSSRVRLAGIDTPESRTTDKEEKELGLEVKRNLASLLLTQKVLLFAQRRWIQARSMEESLVGSILMVKPYQ
jgi:endonuclease YncB( thermonuclease family)